jgi:hypothetical protein
LNRLEGLQGYLGIPLPASTQWDIVAAVAADLAPAFEELIRQAAQGEVLHNDDTTVKILELMGHSRQEAAAAAEGKGSDADERSSLFTSGDLFMSLIYTCQLNEVNPFDYLTQLQRHADQLTASPHLWMPWNYGQH